MMEIRFIRWKFILHILLAALCLTLVPGCVSRLFFHPNSIQYRNEESLKAPVRNEYFESLDGTKLHGWFVSATSGTVQGTVVHFHGNAQNLTAHSSFSDWLPAAGYNVFMFDYRGYGKSEGKPTRKGLYEDGIAALRHVRTLPEVDTNCIAILGQSLGGATALAIAGRNPELAGQALVIDSAFYSYRRIVRDKIRLIPILSLLRVPLSWMVITDAYSPSSTLDRISPVPVLFIHGTADRVIPVHQSHMLYEKASEPKQLLIIENGGHISGLYEFRGQAVPVVLDFLSNAFHHANSGPAE